MAVKAIELLNIEAEANVNASIGQTNAGNSQKRSYIVAKRTLDIVASVIGLVICVLPMMAIIVMIKLESPGPAIYVHHRNGKNGKALPLLKFRTI